MWIIKLLLYIWPFKSIKKCLYILKNRPKLRWKLASVPKIKKKPRFLLFKKAFTKILIEYSNYSNIFLEKNAIELPKNFGMNEHTIKLKESKQPLFGPIYNL